jgi:capsular polysaccharide biosynthesis protein
VNDPDRMATWGPGIDDDLGERLAAYDEPVSLDDHVAGGPSRKLVDLGFIWAALRRRARFWGALAIVGLLIGTAVYVETGASYKATTSVLLVDDPTANPVAATQIDMTLATSLPVATAVVNQLGLQQTPSSFLADYTITSTVAQVLVITANGPSSDEAVRRAAAIAEQFLRFRAQYEKTQLQQTANQLNNQVSQAQQQLNAVTTQLSQVTSQPSSPGQQAQLQSLQARRDAANNSLQQVQQYAATTLSTAQTLTSSLVNNSRVLNQAMPAKSSLIKNMAIYAVGGLIGGLALGIAIVVIGAVTSDRLRRRDDIAYAAGAPVRLSVGPLRKSRWLPESRKRAGARRRDTGRFVQHLRTALPGSSSGPAGLSVVAIDEVRTVARVVVELAGSMAKDKKVVLADLSAGAHAARLLGVTSPGVGTVDRGGARIVVVLPAAYDIAPVGPLQGHASADGYAQPDEALTAACASADIVLSLATLDPACGAQHLATWATEVVAVVTAGQSTATRIQAAGDMIRLAGIRLGSIVVVDADKNDESLGTVSAEYEAMPGMGA